MRKYGKWLLVLGILAASPALVSADGFLSGLRQNLPNSNSAQQQINQRKAEQVAQVLQQARVNGYDLGVEVRGSVVKIDGKVRDVTHRALAERACKTVPGITKVVNNLRYVPPGQIQQTSARMTDNALRPATYNVADGTDDSVQQVHFQKPGKRTAKPRTSQQQQTARPRQQRSSPPASRPDVPTRVVAEAEEQAQPLVKNVSSAVAEPTQAPAPAPAPVAPQQESFTPSNQQVAQQIASSLSHVGLFGYEIVIRYENGLATLEGEVATVEQMQNATMAASRVPGVQDVKNNLAVQGPIAQTAFGAGPYPNGGMHPQAMAMSPMMTSGMPAPGAAPRGPMAPMSMGAAGNYSNPNLPNHAWPAYAAYPNSAAVTYPKQYSASAWPYIGPFYPYPQVPMGWREVSLQWDDGYWQLDFEKKHNAWYWLWNPKNWQ